jgi:hypothetical protein
MVVSEVAMMSVFNTENMKMDQIKKMKDKFKKEEMDRFLVKNSKLLKAQNDQVNEIKKERVVAQ